MTEISSPRPSAALPEIPEGPLRGFYDYWASLPKTNHLPRLGDFFDHVPPAFAPYVAIVDVMGPAETRIRLFGTRLVERVEFDPTGLPVSALYAAHLRDELHDLLWTAVRRPVGYLSRRKIVVRGGYVNEHPSLGLPVEIPTSGVRGVIAFSRSIIESAKIDRDKSPLVQEMKLDRWIDVGAGVA